MELRRATTADPDLLADLPGADGEPSPPPTTWWVERLADDTVEASIVIAGGTSGQAAPTDPIEGVIVVGADPDSSRPGEGTVAWLAVPPEHRRQGHGRRLLLSAERQLQAVGCTTVTLVLPEEAAAGGESMGPFLAAMGWTSDGEGPGRWTRSLSRDADADDAHVQANRRSWDDDADNWVEMGHRAWKPERRRNPTWGCWSIPESEARMLTSAAGADVVELGCGTGYVSSWCLEAGAKSVVGVDNSRRQLATAKVLQQEYGMTFPLVWADAERTPLADASFDLAISEYGAAIWCDPHRWIPEAARLLRPGGRLVFLGNSVLSVLCVPDFEADGPATSALLRPQRGIHRVAWLDHSGVEFHLSHGDMIRLLRSSGFDVLDLRELYLDPTDVNADFAYIDGTWGASWPVEEVWIAERRA